MFNPIYRNRFYIIAHLCLNNITHLCNISNILYIHQRNSYSIISFRFSSILCSPFGFTVICIGKWFLTIPYFSWISNFTNSFLNLKVYPATVLNNPFNTYKYNMTGVSLQMSFVSLLRFSFMISLISFWEGIRISLGWIMDNEKKVNYIFLGSISGSNTLLGEITSNAFIYTVFNQCEWIWVKFNWTNLMTLDLINNLGTI